MKPAFFPCRKSLLPFGYALALGFTTGCGVYVPHVAPTPILSRGKVEVQASVLPMLSLGTGSGLFRLNRPVVAGYVAYSPINHFLVTAMGGGNTISQPKVIRQNGFRERQGDIGVGAYTWLKSSRKLYVSGMIGFGSGSSLRVYDENRRGLFTPLTNSNSIIHQMDARYQRRFAQGQISLVEGAISGTLFLRISQVRYQKLDDFTTDYYYYVPDSTMTGSAKQGAPPNTLYLEPGYAIRFGEGALVGTLEGIFSSPLNRHKPAYDKVELAYNASLITLGLVWRPGKSDKE